MEMHIASLDRNLPGGVVMTAHWTASKTDGDYTASAYGSIDLPAKDPSDSTFIPYDQLTEAQVVEWVKEVMGTERVEALEANLDGQVEAKKNPTFVSDTPWNNTPADPEPEPVENEGSEVTEPDKDDAA